MYLGHTCKGNHDRTKQWISKEGSEREEGPGPSNEENETIKLNVVGMKGEEVDNSNYNTWWKS
jgi:hypothetical protein